MPTAKELLFQAGRFLDSGDNSGAEDAARQLLALGHGGGYHVLALAAQRRGQTTEAFQYFHQCLAARPNDAYPHNSLGNLLLDLGRLEEAAAAFQSAIRLKPTFAEAHNNLGSALERQGQHDAAAAAFREAVRLKP